MADTDDQAFRVLYGAHYRTVCRYLAARADAALVEDVAAETFLVAWRRRGELPAHVVPWLLNTASKCLANQRRSRERSVALVERLAALAPARTSGIDETLIQAAQCRALAAALGALGDRDRELVLLRHWDELAPRELAAALKLSPMLARARLHRAERRLQLALRAELTGEDARHPVDPIEANAVQRT